MSRLGWAAVGGAVTLVCVAAAATAILFRGGISARVEPSAAEARAARALRGRAIPSAARDARSPMPVTSETIALGLAHFADHCASCHANDGSGATALGRGMYPRAPDMRRPETQSLTDGELFYLIEEGIRFTGMPAWGRPGSAEGSWHLVHFIRRLPRLTDEEKDRMESLNPRSPDEWRALQDEEAFLRGEDPPPRDAGGHSH